MAVCSLLLHLTLCFLQASCLASYPGLECLLLYCTGSQFPVCLCKGLAVASNTVGWLG